MQEIKKVTVKVSQAYLDLVNQIFEIEKKATNIKEDNSIQRNINKINGYTRGSIQDWFFNHKLRAVLYFYYFNKEIKVKYQYWHIEILFSHSNYCINA